MLLQVHPEGHSPMCRHEIAFIYFTAKFFCIDSLRIVLLRNIIDCAFRAVKSKDKNSQIDYSWQAIVIILIIQCKKSLKNYTQCATHRHTTCVCVCVCTNTCSHRLRSNLLCDQQYPAKHMSDQQKCTTWVTSERGCRRQSLAENSFMQIKVEVVKWGGEKSHLHDFILTCFTEAVALWLLRSCVTTCHTARCTWHSHSLFLCHSHNFLNRTMLET